MKESKSILLVAMSLLMVLSMAACGGGSEPASTGSGAQASSKPAASSAPAQTGGGSSGGGRDADKLRNELSEGYMGLTENGEFMYYAGNDDTSRALLMFYNPADAKHYVFAGPVTESEEEGWLEITDEKDNLGLLFAVEAVDGGIVLDMGDLGSAILGEATVEDVIAAMLAIEGGTSPVTPGEGAGADEPVGDDEEYVGEDEEYVEDDGEYVDEEYVEDEELEEE